MKKVYCITCKHLCLEKDLKVRDYMEFTNSDSPIHESSHICSFNSSYSELWGDSPIEPRKVRYIKAEDPYVSNRNNDCKNYERSTSKSVKSIFKRIFPNK